MPSKCLRNSLFFLVQIAIELSAVVLFGATSSATGFPITSDTGKLHSNSSTTNTVRYYRLYHVCSGNFLRVTSRHVDVANVHKKTDMYHDLRAESIGFGLVRLQGVSSAHYICFNKINKLISRARPTTDCVFREISDEQMNIQFESVLKPGRYLSFASSTVRQRPKQTMAIPTTVASTASASTGSPQEATSRHRIRHHGKHHFQAVSRRGTSQTQRRTNHDRNSVRCRQFLKITGTVDENSGSSQGLGLNPRSMKSHFVEN